MYRAPEAGAPIIVACMYTKIVGFDRRTGAHAWVFDAGAAMQRLVVAGDRIYAGGSDRIVRLHYPTGALVWTVASPVRTDTLFLDAEEVFVAGAGELAAFSAADGRLLWHDPLKGWGQFDIALATPGNAAPIDRG